MSIKKIHHVITSALREKGWYPELQKMIIVTCILVLCLFLPTSISAQNSTVIDSLVHVLRTSKENTVKLNTLNALSEKFRSNNPDTAIYFASKARALATLLNNEEGIADAGLWTGVAMFRLKNYEKALMNLYEAIKIYDRLLSIDTGKEKATGRSRILKHKAHARAALGVIYTFQNNYPEALKNQWASLSIKEELGDKEGMADSYDYIGLMYERQSNYPEALQNFGEALTLFEKTGNKNGIAKSYRLLGTIYARQGNNPEALRKYFASLKIREETDDQEGISTLYQDIGNIYNERGNYPEALKYYLRSLKIDEQSGDKGGIAVNEYNIGTIYFVQGNYAEALKNLLKSLKILEELRDEYKIARVNTGIAQIYEKQGNYPEALKKLLASLKILEEIGNKEAIGDVYGNIGRIYQLQGNSPEALKNSILSLKINEEIGHKEGIVNACKIIGDIYAELNKYSEATEYVNKGLSIAKETGNLESISFFYEEIYVLDSAQGNFALALEHHKLYTLYEDSLFSKEKIRQIEQLNIQYETERKDKDIELLSKENSIKSLQLERQKVTLLAANLELENNKNELLLMNKSRELQQLQLAITQEDRDHQLLEVKAKTAGMALMEKEKELQAQQLKEQMLLRNGILAGTVLLFLIGLLLFRSLHLRKKLEKHRAILQERKRISADLHDDIGSGLSKISLLSEMVKQQAKSTEARIEAEKIANTARELLDSIREIIWALNAKNDHLENLVAFIRKYAAEYFENSSVRLKIETPGIIPQKSISGEYRRNIFYSAKEAMHNIVKHAGATEAELKFTMANNVFTISIRDNGKGISVGEPNRFGNGIKNIKSRMRAIHGNVSIENHAGTRITLALPV